MPYSFMARLFLNSLAIPLFFILILCMRKFLGSHLTSRDRYRLWFPFLLLLTFPFLQFLHLGTYTGYLPSQLFWGIHPKAAPPPSPHAYETAVSGKDLFLDFSISVICNTPSIVPVILFVLWAVGVVFMTMVTLYSHHQVRRLKKSSLLLQNERIRALFESCLRESGIRRDIPIYSSAYVKSPIAVGFLFPSIIVPIHILSEMPEKDIRYILLHELSHCRHKDLFISQLMALAQIVYWFHPVVWLAFKTMEHDREIACDSSVLSMLPPEQYLDYGNTLINFAEKLSRFPYCTTGIGGSKKEIRKRIISIARFQKESKKHRMKSGVILVTTTLFIASLSPYLSAGAAYDGNYKFHGENINKLDVESCFCGKKGSFVLYKINSDQYSIYNENEVTKRISPDSTYKIYSALAALEKGVIAPSSSKLRWNGNTYPYEAWNEDQTLNSAMKYSVNWYFTELDKQTGLNTLKRYFQNMGYGNSDFSGGLGRFWAESTLKISPVEQVELLTRFYQGNLNVSPENQRAIKDSLFISSSKGASLYGKTGTGAVNGKQINGWFIGFVEAAEETYVFATNIQDTDSASGSAAAKITMEILNERNIYGN